MVNPLVEATRRQLVITLAILSIGCSTNTSTQSAREPVPVDTEQYTTQLEELVATCMTEQGFDYNTAAAQKAYTFESESDGPENDHPAGDADSGHTEGLFLDSTPIEVEQGVPYHPAMPPDASVDQKKAWFEAFSGHKPSEMADADEWGGCYGAASEQASKLVQLAEDPEALTDEEIEILSSDSIVVSITQDWAKCMSDRGYSVSDGEDIERYLEQQSLNLSENELSRLEDELSSADEYCLESEDVEPRIAKRRLELFGEG